VDVLSRPTSSKVRVLPVEYSCVEVNHPMIEPVKSVSQLLENPDTAEPLLDVVLWMTTPKVTKTPEYDQILDMLCSAVPDFRNWRDEHIKKRLAA